MVTRVARHRCRLAIEVDAHRDGPCGILHIVAIVQRILIVRNDLGRLDEVRVVQNDFLGLDFVGSAAREDDVDDLVHIADVHHTVTVGIGTGVVIALKDAVDDLVHIGDIHRAVTIHVARHGTGGQTHSRRYDSEQ